MTIPADKQRKRALGLWGLKASDETAVSVASTGAHGFAPTEGLDVDALNQGLVDTDVVNLPALAGTGWSVEASTDDPLAWHVFAPQPVTTFVGGPKAPPHQTVYVEEEDPAAVHLNLRNADEFALQLPDGSGVWIEVKAGQPFVKRLSTGELPGPSVSPPVEDWQGPEVDGWLAQQLNRPTHTAWGKWAAAGLYARLRNPTVEQARALAERGRKGEQDPDWERPRLWAQAVPADDALAGLGLLLRGAVENQCRQRVVAAEVDPDSEEWEQSLLAVLHHRDDLESVSLLLDHRGLADEDKRLMNETLADLDRAGERFILSVPYPVNVQRDERLRRAGALEPDAWWTRPAWPAGDDA